MSHHGILLVDKAAGCTSHDVVSRARRAFRTRSVGHAGTLDPMATGLLVLGIGEGTKLLNHHTGKDKHYSATVSLGAETDSLDAEGDVIREMPIAEHLTEGVVGEVLETLLGNQMQMPPALSAIKKDGQPAHRRVRRGEDVVMEARPVVLHAARVTGYAGGEIQLEVHCGKGFYVRSLARDLANALGTVGHLSKLRRTRCGSFSIDDACAQTWLEQAAREQDVPERERDEAMLSMADAVHDMRRVVLDPDGCDHAFHGRPIARAQCEGDTWPESPEEPVALFAPDGLLIALARGAEDELHVTRGFRYEG